MESRKYPDRPIIGVGVCLLVEDSILLVKRANPPLVGAWSLPGGTQKLGETVKECGVREIKEETGLDIVITETIDVIDSIHLDNDKAILYHFTLIDYMGKVMSGKLAPGDDALDVQWFSRLEAIKSVSWQETRRIINLAFEMAQLSKNKF